MIPPSPIVKLGPDLDLDAPSPAVRGPRRRPSGRLRFILRVVVILIAMVLASSATITFVYLADLTGADALRARATAAEEAFRAAEVEAAEQTALAADQASTISRLQDAVSGLLGRVEAVSESKIRRVVETQTVVKKVIRWIPHGEGVSVEITGFEGRIRIHDVQLTQAYGYSDLIGIAINKTSQTISYAQLGCTFLDADGKVLANAMVNKLNWAPEQTWGFDCSAQVDATGGILRVDEMS